MKFFTNKKFLFKLIATLCICLTVINFTAVPIAQAADGELVSKVGGVLLDPICTLLLALGDGVMEILQKSIMGTGATAIFDTGTGNWWKILVAVVAVILAVVIGVVTAGWGAVIMTALKIVTTITIAHVITNGALTAAVSTVVGSYFNVNVVLPTFTIGPEEIFAGKILLFDPNIFNPKQVYVDLKLDHVPTDNDYVIVYVDNIGSTGIKINRHNIKSTDKLIVNGKEYTKSNAEELEQLVETNGEFIWNGILYQNKKDGNGWTFGYDVNGLWDSTNTSGEKNYVIEFEYDGLLPLIKINRELMSDDDALWIREYDSYDDDPSTEEPERTRLYSEVISKSDILVDTLTYEFGGGANPWGDGSGNEVIPSEVVKTEFQRDDSWYSGWYTISWKNITYEFSGIGGGTWVPNTNNLDTGGIKATGGAASIDAPEPVKIEEWNETKEENGEIEYTNQYRNMGYIPDKYFYYKDGNPLNNSEENIVPTSVNNAALELKGTVQKWYYIIRNIAILGLMLVLIYVGIKILTSTVASDKAKYKQMIGDWVIALCLIFLMQYIMVFANSFVESITELVADFTNTKKNIVVISEAPEKLQTEVADKFKLDGEETGYVDKESDLIAWPTNLMGRMRIEAQQHDGTADYIGKTICYMVLVMYTIFFSYTYAKRLLYLLFFTVISPLVALTYPIDKIRDGQAQAFNMWIKEYIINLIIQPFHLMLYTIFVSMAFDLAGTNIIYSLVVIGFMMPAEKFLRSMFGFNKATTPGFLGGAAGAALTISGMKSLSSFAGRGPGGKGPGGKGSGESRSSKNNKIRSADSGYTADKLMGEVIGINAANGNNADTSGRDTRININVKAPNSRGIGSGNNTQAVPRLFNGDGGEIDFGNMSELELKDFNDSMNSKAANDLRLQGYSEADIANILRVGNGLDLRLEDVPEDMIDEGNIEQEVEEQIEAIPEENIEPIQQVEVGRFKGKIKSILGDIGTGFKETSGYLGARFSNAIEDNFTREKFKGLAIKGAKSAVKYGIGATGAAIGIAAGIASGSPGDTFKYGTAGAYAGSSIGQGLTNRAGAATEREKARHEEALRKQHGDSEYQKLKNAELDKEFKNNSETRKKYALRFGTTNKQELDKVMDDAIEYRKYGVTEDEVIMKAMALEPDNRIDKRSIAAAKLSLVSKSEKDLKTTMERFGKTNGVREEHMIDMETRIRKINRSTLN